MHETQTDEFGLINLTIGKGKKSTGTNFDQIAWNGLNKVLVVEVKIDGQANYYEVSNQTLLYSPYALYADAVEYKNINNAPKDVSHFKNDVGYLVTNDLKPLEKKINENQTENLSTFTLLKDQQVKLETKVDDQGKKLTETILITQNLSSRIDQQNNQITQNQNTLINQINGLGGSFESLGNKSTANTCDYIFLHDVQFGQVRTDCTKLFLNIFENFTLSVFPFFLAAVFSMIQPLN